ncbi:Ankyrin repeat domain-containing protein 13C, partial [Gamsiella multidivaricata]
GFENLKWIRGHISIIFRVDPESGPELVVVDRIKKITQRLAKSSDDDHKQDYEPTDEEIEEEVSTCFNSEITSTNVPTSAIKFQRAKTGLWGYRTNKVEKVGEFDCAVWKMDGVEFRTRVRSEHLRDETGKPIQALKRMSHGHGGHKHQVPHQRHHQHEGAIEASGHVESGEPEKGVVLKFGADRAEKRGGRGAQPRRPIHQPLFSPFAAEPESESNRGEAIVGDENQTKQQVSFTAPGSNTTGAPGEGAALSIPKKHTRSTGTISDDAFFETALQEAEGEMNEGDESEDEDQDPQVMYRESLTPPPATRVTFEEYFDPSKQGELHLGRPLEQKESRKTFGATLWMYDSNNSSKTGSGSSTLHENSSQASIGASSVASSQGSLFGNKAQTQAPQFPLTIEKILPLLEVVGMDNNRLVGKLKEFLEFQLPPGFPIRANIPVYPSLSADVTFVNYDAQRIIEDEMFEIPGESQGYAEGFIIRRGGEDDT